MFFEKPYESLKGTFARASNVVQNRSKIRYISQHIVRLNLLPVIIKASAEQIAATTLQRTTAKKKYRSGSEHMPRPNIALLAHTLREPGPPKPSH